MIAVAKTSFEKINNFLANKEFRFAAVVALSYQLVLTVIGWLIEISNKPSTMILSHTMKWDAGWYMNIINDHYVTNSASPAFYPLFPLAVSSIHNVSFGLISYEWCAQIINLFSLFFIVLAFKRIASINSEKGYYTIALFLSFPSAFFLHVFYGEAIFIALGLWAYIYARKQKWFQMSVLIAFASASRLPAILYIGLCLLEYLKFYKWQIRKALNINVLYFLMSLSGFLLYGLYLKIVRGDFFAMFSAYHASSDWVYQTFNPNFVETWLRVGYQILRALFGLRPFDNDLIVNHFVPLICLLALAAASIYLIKKPLYRNIGIVGVIATIMFSLNSNLVSVHRYILAYPAIFIALPLAKNKIKNYFSPVIITTGIVLQLILYYKYINLIFAG